MSSKQQPLIINGWEKGIAESPHMGVGLIKNADINSFPGAVKVALAPQQSFHKINTVTFTADAATDLCTASGAIESNGVNFTGAAVYFTTTGTLPAGLSINTIYFLYNQSSTTFKVCTSYKNSAGSATGTVINITDAGTGTHTMNAVAIGTINWIIKDPRTGSYWMLGSNGRVWFIPSGTRAYLLHNSAIDTGASTPTNASGQGIALSPFSSTTSTYLFVFRNALIDVIDVYGTTAIEALAWSNGWKSMNTGAGSGNSHHAIKGQDDVIYFCDDRYVGSIKENSGSTFDPASAGTFTYNNQALDTPAYEIAQCLEELGTNLFIGGNSYNKIYPWDRISDSFNNPLVVQEVGIKRMKNIGGLVYILTGTWGNIYTTQGTYVKFLRKIPTYVVNGSYSIVSNPVTWGGIADANGALVFGLAGQTTGSSGIYRLYPDGRLIHDNMPSTGSANVIGLLAENDFYLMGYSGGMDNFSGLSAQYTSNFETVLQSQLYKVGTKTNKAAYSTLEVQVARPMTSGSIRISYRTGLAASFTTISTFTSDASATSFFLQELGLTDLENIQIQVEMQGNGEFMEVRLYP